MVRRQNSRLIQYLRLNSFCKLHLGSIAMACNPKRRWYQFSLIQLLFVLTIVCVGPGGYVAYEQKKAREQKTAVEAIERLGGRVSYQEDVPARSATMRWILGDETFGNVETVRFDKTLVTDADLVHLAALPRLTSLTLSQTNITDRGLMQHVARIKTLEAVGLYDMQATDEGIDALKKALPNCVIGRPKWRREYRTQK
jgi:hypothetical protein